MRVTLSFEKSISSDVSVMVDMLRASTTITLALDNFKNIIPCFTPEDAFKLKKEYGGVLAGERNGSKIEGFDFGNSPCIFKDLKSDEDNLILTTSNGTRILENMTGNVLIGSLANAESCGLKSVKLAENHIDVVMAGVKGKFAVEDFLASGEILYQISRNLDEYELSEYAKAAILASRNHEAVISAVKSSNTAKRLIKLGYEDDVDLCCEKNISDNVGNYFNKRIVNLNL